VSLQLLKKCVFFIRKGLRAWFTREHRFETHFYEYNVRKGKNCEARPLEAQNYNFL
jgi:hypothetical protein